MSAINFDFHCHSSVSDGLLPPFALPPRAAANGVSLLALTDHDDCSGLAEAAEAARIAGITLVNGVEISIEWKDISIHVLGLGIDPQQSLLAEGLASIRTGRVGRAERMAAALEKIGIPGVLKGALQYAENPSLISRAHFARFLVSQGICRDVKSVFDAYLTPGKPGYVEHRWPTLNDALTWIQAAGGVAVVAHPGRYKMSGQKMREFLQDFHDGGGRGIEVVSGSHTPDHVLHFARLARYFAFHASRGSDFHGPGESYFDLGRLPALPEDLKPVWRLVS